MTHIQYCGGAIVARFLKRDTIAPPVAQMYPDRKIGILLRHQCFSGVAIVSRFLDRATFAPPVSLKIRKINLGDNMSLDYIFLGDNVPEYFSVSRVVLRQVGG